VDAHQKPRPHPATGTRFRGSLGDSSALQVCRPHQKPLAAKELAASGRTPSSARVRVRGASRCGHCSRHDGAMRRSSVVFGVRNDCSTLPRCDAAEDQRALERVATGDDPSATLTGDATLIRGAHCKTNGPKPPSCSIPPSEMQRAPRQHPSAMPRKRATLRREDERPRVKRQRISVVGTSRAMRFRPPRSALQANDGESGNRQTGKSRELILA
jgi:hypothetical protein